MTAPAAGHDRATVAVGYDGSEAAQDAVRWAAEYAAAGNYRIRVIHAWVWPMFTKKLGPVKGVEGSGLRHSAEAILAEGVDAGPHGPRRANRRRRTAAASGAGRGPARHPARRIPPSKVSWKPGSRRRCCATRPGDARLLVVSSRGLGGVLGHVAGSVCLDLAGSSPCPLMVIRRRRSPGGPRPPSWLASTGRPGAPRRWPAPPGWPRSSGRPLQIVHIDQTSRQDPGRARPACPARPGAAGPCPGGGPEVGPGAVGHRRPAGRPRGVQGTAGGRRRRRRPGDRNPQPLRAAPATPSPPS